ncbi:restriction endonuclease subunit S [Gallibacterium salpingitidis]|nr:restriction endonuclease subunit S [Gallibacterium salpingitidis]
MKFKDILTISSGIPFSRIEEDFSAPSYSVYSQNDLQADLGITSVCIENKLLRTYDKVSTVKTGDIIFSLISGTAARVQAARSGYIYSQNYAVLLPNPIIDKNFLVYLINCDQDVKHQFAASMQGSQVLKYTLNQLRQLELKTLPDLSIQQAIGKIYMSQNRLMTLKNRLIERENQYLLSSLNNLIKQEKNK